MLLAEISLSYFTVVNTLNCENNYKITPKSKNKGEEGLFSLLVIRRIRQPYIFETPLKGSIKDPILPQFHKKENSHKPINTCETYLVNT